MDLDQKRNASSEHDDRDDQAKERAQAIQKLTTLIGEIDAYRVSVKDKMEAGLNEFLKLYHPKDADSKKAVADFVAVTLKRLGFVIEYQGQPCAMYAGPGARRTQGRFRLTPHGSNKSLTEPVDLAPILPLKVSFSILPKTPKLLVKIADAEGWQEKVSGQGTKGRENSR